jgi:DNA-binding GntR family transcriptional regulator
MDTRRAREPAMRYSRAAAKRRQKVAVRAPSLNQQAYDEIKHRIITLAYPPGSYLNEVGVSDELGIGRTPVHHALHRLAQEEFVDVIPRKGVVVRPISMDEVAQIIDVRLLNEPFCASLAARRVRQADLEIPKALLLASKREVELGDGVEELMRLDRQFHNWITEISGHTVLADIVNKLHDRAARFWFLSLREGDHPARVVEEHTQILHAIALRDEAKAAKAARDHIESFRDTILRVV